MCFSATASFTAGAALAVAGVFSIRSVSKPSQYPFAFIPLFFAVQQICEGFLWLSFSDSAFAPWHDPAKYTFLIFAQIIWPFWIPLSFMLIEQLPKRRKVMQYLFLGGIAGSLLLSYRLTAFDAVAQIDGCHIEYDIVKPQWLMISTGILYIGAIVVAPFFSSWKYTKLLASVNVVSLVVTELFFDVYFVSVWCFFAAVQSVIIVWITRRFKKEIDD